MFHPLSVGQIRRSYCNFVNQARLHVNTDMAFVAVPILIFPLTTHTGLLIHGYFRQRLVVELFHFLRDHLVSLLP